jgi:ribonuclease BN (tRNA processing enzyme)
LWQPATDQLKATGYDPHSLHAILLTHSHWDHVRTMWPRSLRTTAERRACRGARRERCS